ncbi:hypothetical protein [Streptomyces sp. AC558_RSS880]|uniref:hypothetical protein n=1 Tax=Streptomyces sp. AC558_RSS880 TaxID=2823687 RepID=UPI001C231612|nr:hypothetical protein [Streptomyces sp. AC558_RSS880]
MSEKTPPAGDALAEAEAAERPLTLALLRYLVNRLWRHLPGDRLVVLALDNEDNGYSPLATWGEGRYAPLPDDEFTGELFPTPEEMAKDQELRELFSDGIPDTAVPALVLYPLG